MIAQIKDLRTKPCRLLNSVKEILYVPSDSRGEMVENARDLSYITAHTKKRGFSAIAYAIAIIVTMTPIKNPTTPRSDEKAPKVTCISCKTALKKLKKFIRSFSYAYDKKFSKVS